MQPSTLPTFYRQGNGRATAGDTEEREPICWVMFNWLTPTGSNPTRSNSHGIECSCFIKVNERTQHWQLRCWL